MDQNRTSRRILAMSALPPKADIVQHGGNCLPPGFYARAMAIFEVMLALTFPSLRSGARYAPMAALNLRCVPAGNVARDGASGLAASALVA
jgi:hypothetical protein